eukprot:3089693-Amphidinium_carterae.1
MVHFLRDFGIPVFHLDTLHIETNHREWVNPVAGGRTCGTPLMVSPRCSMHQPPRPHVPHLPPRVHHFIINEIQSMLLHLYSALARSFSYIVFDEMIVMFYMFLEGLYDNGGMRVMCSVPSTPHLASPSPSTILASSLSLRTHSSTS